MNRFIRTIILYFSFCISLYAQVDTFFEYPDYSSIKDNFFPNEEGSENEKKLIKYIESFLKFHKLSYTKTKIEGNLYTTNSYNIEVVVNDDIKKDEDILIICPLNSYLYQNNFMDNSLTIKIMLNLIKVTQTMNLNKRVVFLFSGANRRDKREGEGDFLGFKNYINNRANFSRSLVILLDLLSNKEKIKFSGSFNKKPIPLLFLKIFLNLENKKNFYFDKKEIINSKLNTITISNFLTFILDKNIQTIGFSNQDKTFYNQYLFDYQYEADLTNYFLEWIKKFDTQNYPFEIDYNYQYFDFGYFYFLVPEYIEVLIFILVIFLIFLLRNVLPSFQRLNLKLMIKILPFFTILFVLFYLISFIPYLFFLLITLFTNTTPQFFNIPILYFLLIYFVPQMFIFLFYEILEKLPFPKHNYLYIFGSMIFSYINLFLFIIIDISFAYIYLWVVILITLSNFTGKNYFIKFAFYFIVSIPIIKLIFDISTLSNIDAVKNIFNSPLLLHLIFTIVVFPILLLLIRVRVILRSKFKISIFDKTSISFLLILIFFSITLIFIFISQKKESDEKDIFAKLISTKNRKELFVDSESNIKSISVIEGNYKKFHTFKDIKSFKIDIDEVDKNYTIEKTTTKRYEQTICNITIKSQKKINYLNIFLICNSELYPLETNYYFDKYDNFTYDKVAPNEIVYKFLIPANIYDDFNFNLTLLSNFKYRLFITLEYPFIENNLNIVTTQGYIQKYTKFIEEINL